MLVVSAGNVTAGNEVVAKTVLAGCTEVCVMYRVDGGTTEIIVMMLVSTISRSNGSVDVMYRVLRLVTVDADCTAVLTIRMVSVPPARLVVSVKLMVSAGSVSYAVETTVVGCVYVISIHEVEPGAVAAKKVCVSLGHVVNACESPSNHSAKLNAALQMRELWTEMVTVDKRVGLSKDCFSSNNQA